MNELDRRTVLRGVGAAGALAAATPLLVACGGGSGGTTGSGAGGASVSVATGDVPVGGGVISGKVVVTQPEAGTYKAFSAVCTHQSCTVATVSDNVITCPCHNSQFSASDGSVISGPAPSPLPAKTATVTGSDVVVT